ncbi:rod shape-determining protein MreD [Candidatus Daviesbacteria bacterium]|nr:rod shape-determining protein MreD [Candidatus Daviesbacteria bacterium]MBI4035439.1 rod shape-determining protein MreD [Candidatus Daviesbacteria bacterium]
MKTLIIILNIAAFLQTTILPLNLVAIILICRSYIRSDRTNLFLAFFFGLLTSHLSLRPLGFDSLIYLLIILIVQLVATSRLSQHPFWILPISFSALFLNLIAFQLVSHQSIQLFPQILIETVLSIPIFYVIKIWEERFIVRKDIKLRI